MYPELVHELIGEETYLRCDQDFGSTDPDTQQAAMDRFRAALLASAAYNKGFTCSVAVGWKGGKPAKGEKPQTVFLRPDSNETANTEETPPSDWEIVHKAGGTAYAHPKIGAVSVEAEGN
jgi:hypothetical protein